MVYSDEIEDKIDALMDALEKRYPDLDNLRWHAIKLLESDTEITRGLPGGSASGSWTTAMSRRSSIRSMTLLTR